MIAVGGGPAGLSTALYTAKTGLDTVVFDTDDTWMDHPHLFSYLGIESIDGRAFIELAREQVDGFGAERRRAEVIGLEAHEAGLSVRSAEAKHAASYVVLATGDDTNLAERLGCSITEHGLLDSTSRSRRVSRTPTRPARWSARRSTRR